MGLIRHISLDTLLVPVKSIVLRHLKLDTTLARIAHQKCHEIVERSFLTEFIVLYLLLYDQSCYDERMKITRKKSHFIIEYIQSTVLRLCLSDVNGKGLFHFQFLSFSHFLRKHGTMEEHGGCILPWRMRLLCVRSKEVDDPRFSGHRDVISNG